MAEEIELKLAIPRSAWRAVLHHPQLVAAEKLPTRKLINIYYDTPDFVLRRKGVALRLRKQGQQWLQTVKCAGVVAGGLSTRPEWEYPYGGERFDFQPIDDDELRRWLSRDKLVRRLQPTFHTTFSRHTWRLAPNKRSTILVMFDRGVIESGSNVEFISEIELELVRGSVRRLFGLAHDLAASLPLRPESASKAERGFRLFAGTPLAPQKATTSPFAPGHCAREAFNAIGLACVAHIQANEAGVMAGPDPEFIHQMRVAMRRLRSAMRLFAPALNERQIAATSTRLGKFAAALGATRDWDVLIAELLRPVANDFPDDPHLERLVAAAATRRSDAYEQAVAELGQPAYGRLMIDLLDLFHQPGTAAKGGALPTSEFAENRLLALNRRLRKAAKRAHGLDISALHRLRIAVKRLRYALEFFAPIYSSKSVKRDLRKLTRLQDDLGLINDVANAGPRLALCANEHPALHAAVAKVGAWYVPHYQALMSRLPDDMETVVKNRFVWER
jgi:inorganic triphosphatase YgiF